MTPAPHATPVTLVVASLLTSPQGAELHLVAADGRLVRLPADEETARALALNLWRALDRPS